MFFYPLKRRKHMLLESLKEFLLFTHQLRRVRFYYKLRFFHANFFVPIIVKPLFRGYFIRDFAISFKKIYALSGTIWPVFCRSEATDECEE